MRNLNITLFLCVGFLCLFSSQLVAQHQSYSYAEVQDQTSLELSPRGALLRSFVLPGWGHHYVDQSNWTRGKIHLATDVILIAGLVGFSQRANRLEGDLVTLARSKAGVNISNRDRRFELAVSDFNSLDEYNDYQLRTRNWQNIYSDTPENRWSWSTTNDREDFRDTRSKISKAENQIPTMLTLMVANRIFSGINAFVKARDIMDNPPVASVSYLNEFGTTGLTARISFQF